MPSLAIIQGDGTKPLSKEGADNLLESWERRHKGASRAGKPALLERGYKVETVGIPQKDAQFIETRQFGVADVSRWFRVPPHKIGDMGRATWANIESQERNFVNDCITPWITRLEQEAWLKLVDDPAVYTKLDVRGLLRGDSDARATYYTKMRDLGVTSINEIRALEDMDPIEGGDVRFVPANMISLERASKAGGTDPASSIRGVLLDAHERMMVKEARALERARSKGEDIVAWAADFYGRHAPQMRDALMPGASSLASLENVGSDIVAGLVESHASLYCEAAMTAVASGVWEPGGKQAARETDRLIGRMIGAIDA